MLLLHRQFLRLPPRRRYATPSRFSLVAVVLRRRGVPSLSFAVRRTNPQTHYNKGHCRHSTSHPVRPSPNQPCPAQSSLSRSVPFFLPSRLLSAPEDTRRATTTMPSAPISHPPEGKRASRETQAEGDIMILDYLLYMA